VEVGGARSRGWIDLLAYQPRFRTLLVIEVKTEIHDIGAIERSINLYRRESGRVARRFGWRPNHVLAVLLVLQSRANDGRIASDSEVFAAAFPGRAIELRSVIEGSVDPLAGRYLAMIDPRSRRSIWLWPTRSDGRRSPAPYVDYIDAARQLERDGSAHLGRPIGARNAARASNRNECA
jgi:hypothetical protein